MRGKRLIRLAALLMALLLTASQAFAVTGVLSAVDPGEQPLELTLGVKLNAYSPLDDVRTGWLNDLLSYHQLRLRLYGDSTDMSMLINGGEAFSISLTQGDSGSSVTTTLLPGQTYASDDDDALSLLTGSTATGSDALLPGFDSLDMLDDALTMLQELQRTGAEYIVTKKKKNVVKGYGTATRSLTLTMDEDQATDFGTLLIASCPDGKLMEQLITFNFTEEQSITMLTDDNGTIYKVTYSGICGVDGNMRRVSLTWKLLRTDARTRDDLTLKLPFAASAGKDQLSFTRDVQTKSGTVTDSTSFTRSSTINGEKASMDLSWDLTSATDKTGTTTISGSARMTSSGSNETDRDLGITVNVKLSADATGSGTVSVKNPASGTALQSADISVQIAPLQTVVDDEVMDAATPTDLDRLPDTDLTSLRTQLYETAARELVARWIALPDDAALYISKDLPDDFWMRLGWAALDYSDEEE